MVSTKLGKPAYTMGQLKEIDTDSLVKRLELIDNKLAWRLAAELFVAAHSNRPLINKSMTDLEIKREVQSTASRASYKKSGASPANFHHSSLTLLYKDILKLSSVKLSRFALDDPKDIRDSVYSERPILRLIMPKAPLSNTTEIVPFLLENFQLLVNPRKGLPLTLAKVRNFVGWWIYNSLSINLAFFFTGTGYSIVLVIPALLITILITAMIGRVDTAYSAMALFISFTDEFIDDERQYDDPAIGESG